MLLLSHLVQGELAVANAPRQAVGHGRHRFFAIHLNKIGEGGKEGGIDEHLGFNAVAQGFVPRVEDIAERSLTLIIIAGLGR